MDGEPSLSVLDSLSPAYRPEDSSNENPLPVAATLSLDPAMVGGEPSLAALASSYPRKRDKNMFKTPLSPVVPAAPALTVVGGARSRSVLVVSSARGQEGEKKFPDRVPPSIRRPPLPQPRGVTSASARDSLWKNSVGSAPFWLKWLDSDEELGQAARCTSPASAVGWPCHDVPVEVDDKDVDVGNDLDLDAAECVLLAPLVALPPFLGGKRLGLLSRGDNVADSSRCLPGWRSPRTTDGCDWRFWKQLSEMENLVRDLRPP